jgi:hypothetical protein
MLRGRLATPRLLYSRRTAQPMSKSNVLPNAEREAIGQIGLFR